MVVANITDNVERHYRPGFLTALAFCAMFWAAVIAGISSLL